jgi:hypothetical protein
VRAEEVGQHQEKIIPGIRIVDLGAARGWRKRHWKNTGQVDRSCGELLPESDDLLRDYVLGRAPEQDENLIMRAVPRDGDQPDSLAWSRVSADTDCCPI